jgi:hypothetical protein
MNKEEDPVSLDLILTKYRFGIAILTILVIIAAFLYAISVTKSEDMAAVMGVFAGVIGTIFGSYVGTDIGSKGKKEAIERTEQTIETNKKINMANTQKIEDNLDELEKKLGITSKTSEKIEEIKTQIIDLKREEKLRMDSIKGASQIDWKRSLGKPIDSELIETQVDDLKIINNKLEDETKNKMMELKTHLNTLKAINEDLK